MSPSAATSVTVAASHASFPRRVAIRSAMEVAFVSRASLTRRNMNAPPSRYRTIAPTKVGGMAQPLRAAWVTVP
jgi:hypothetical protein